MTECLKRIDNFSRDFKFNIDGDGFSTSFGGIISIFIFIGTLFCTYHFGNDIYYKQSPNFYTDVDYTDESPIFQFSYDNFLYSIRLEDGNGAIIDDPRYFEYTFKYLYYKMNNKTNQMDLIINEETIMKRCSADNVIASDVKAHGLSDFYCADLVGKKFGGNWMRAELAQPMYFIKRCSNKTESRLNIKCATDSEVVAKYPYIYFGHKILRTIFRVENYTYPTKRVYDYVSTILNPIQPLQWNYCTHFHHFYSNNTIDTDNGPLSNNDVLLYFLDFHYSDNWTGPKNEDSDKYVVFESTIGPSKQVIYYNRSYIRVPDIIANVGGFIGLFIPIIEFFFSFYVDNKFQVFLYDKLFQLVSEINENDVKSQKIDIKEKMEKSEKSEVELVPKTVFPNTPKSKSSSTLRFITSKKLRNTPLGISPNLRQIIEEGKGNSKTQDINISVAERCDFLYCLCCKKKSILSNSIQKAKYELMIAADREIDFKCNVLDLFKYLEQLKLLKMIVLNKSQCFMLENRELEVITDLVANNDTFKDLAEEKIASNKENLVKYLKASLTKKDNNRYIDTFLFKYVSKDIKELIAKEGIDMTDSDL